MTTKVLFISHDAQPHGAQIMLLHLIRWLAAHCGITPHILLKRDGPLRRDFAAIGPTQVVCPDNLAELLRSYQRESFDLIYSNTITNGELLAALAILDCPVISHVHELSYWITYRSGALNNAQVIQHSDCFIAASRAVSDCLKETLQLASEKIFVIHEIPALPPEGFDPVAARIRARAELSLTTEGLVVGGSGTTDWRKSPDLFVQLARQVTAQFPTADVHFVWVGGDNTGPEFGMIWHDVCRLGLEKQMHFLGHIDQPSDYFAAFDLFALTSREDPYPLVVLEAAALGLPIVGFDRSGGVPEFIEKDCGFVVPYLDTNAMATRTIQLLQDPDLRRRLGARAKEKVLERHDLGLTAQRVANLIEWAKLSHRLQQHPRRQAA